MIDLKKSLGLLLFGMTAVYLGWLGSRNKKFKHICISCHRAAKRDICIRMAPKGHLWGGYRRLFCSRCRSAKTKLRPGPQQRARWSRDFEYLKSTFEAGIKCARPRLSLWPGSWSTHMTVLR